VSVVSERSHQTLSKADPYEGQWLCFPHVTFTNHLDRRGGGRRGRREGGGAERGEGRICVWGEGEGEKGGGEEWPG